ncbi:MAG: hypothetical protein WKG32_07180 [Gemmatimonadaceae bacterium]
MSEFARRACAAARRPLGVLGALALAVVASGHVGSPDVYFQGKAGPYDVGVTIRPPGVVPGLADITIHVPSADARRVSVRPVFWQTSLAGAPRADEARAVPGEAGLYSAQLWLMTAGSYSVHVTVEGARGSGTAFVPLNSIATQRLGMQPATAGVLLGLGAFLVIGLLSIVGAGAREGSLEPGASPDPRRRRKARIVTTVFAGILVLELTAGKAWWGLEDAAYRRSMARPLRVSASTRSEGGHAVIRVALDDPSWVGGRTTPLVPDHGKMMHLFLIRAPGLDGFAHLHPRRVDPTTFEATLPPLPAGSYRLYGDVVHASGYARTVTDTVEISAGGLSGAAPSDSDDSWLAPAAAPAEPRSGQDGSVRQLAGGGSMTWERGAEAPRAGRPASLRFVVRDVNGQAAVLEPYMSMRGHAAVTRDDGAVFVHLHPMGTISTASQRTFEERARGDTTAAAITAALARPSRDGEHATHGGEPGIVTFPYAFPSPGRYRLWVQVKRAGVVETGQFDVTVGDSIRTGARSGT